MDRHHWIVQYEQGGRLYTYFMSFEEMTSKMTERYEIRLGVPFRTWVIVNDEMEKVNIAS